MVSFSRPLLLLSKLRAPVANVSNNLGKRWSTVAAQSTIATSTKLANRPKLVGTWLLSCAGVTFGTVLLGGVTRLTKSGLSMVDWHPFAEFPPKTDEDWKREFEKYQEFPEFKISNRDMTLNEFKRIWWMEYIHRMSGRSIGALFFIPAAVFWGLGVFPASMKKRVIAMGTLLAFQGGLGWYMVRSGLKEDQPYATPRVSHYRLAAHLGTAFVLYSLLLRSAFDHLFPVKPFSGSSLKSYKAFRGCGHLVKTFVFLTALSGAFVAGLEAGLVYNTFPKMADRWVPSDLMALEPKYKNFFENPTTVQFDHRILGESTFVVVCGVWLWSRRLALPTRCRAAINLTGALAITQVALGITTLLTYVPVHIASMHQAGALSLLTAALWLGHELKALPK